MRILEEYFNKKDLLRPYADYNDYLRDNFNWVEIVLLHYVTFLSNVKSMEIDTVYDEDKLKSGLDFLKKDALLDSRGARFFINNRVKADNKKFYAGEYILRRYKLSNFEWFCVVALIANLLNKKINKMFRTVSDFFGEKKINIEVLYKIYRFSYEIEYIKSEYKIIDDAIDKLEKFCLTYGKFEINKRTLEFIIYNSEKNISISGVELILPQIQSNSLPVREKIAKDIQNFITSSDTKRAAFINLEGETGIGKSTLLKRVAQLQKEALLVVNLSKCHIDNKMKFSNILITCFREVALNGGYIGILGLEILYSNIEKYKYNIDFIFNKITSYSKVVFFLSEKDLKTALDSRSDRFLFVHLDNLDSRERLILWKNNFENIKDVTDIKAFEMANKFAFTPGQIAGTVRRAKNLYLSRGKKKLDSKDLCECAYSQIVNTLSEKATRVQSKHTWKDLILNEKEKEMLKNACAQVKYKHIVYDKWNMKERILYGRGVSMLFAGPPGTGKTMAAGVIANDLGLEIYRVDLSQIVSKYIGETEKNLNSIFNEAKSSNVILFFDETDALFGKRTEVKDSHDKNANVETSFLLQKMEEYDGITIMTTNFLQNIDSAFFRRISYVIHFEFPDKNSRKKIWENMYTPSVPKAKNIDFDYLARQFEIAGGNIKNIAVTSLFLAARSEEKILNMKHILMAVRYELKKQGKTLLKADFNEYSYLM